MEQKEFTTKEAVDKHIATLEEYPLGFCPVIRQDCRTDCLCYFSHFAQNRSRYDMDTRKQVSYFTVGLPFCDHVLISGLMSIQ